MIIFFQYLFNILINLKKIDEYKNYLKISLILKECKITNNEGKINEWI